MHSFILPNDWIYVASSLSVISGLLNLILFMIMTVEDIKQIPYLIFSLYSTIMNVMAYFCSKRLYAEQQEEKTVEVLSIVCYVIFRSLIDLEAAYDYKTIH